MEGSSGARVGLDDVTTRGRASVEYSILGPIEVRRGDDLVDVGGVRPKALLGLLLINANSVVSTDRIIDELWGEGTGKDPQNALWVTVSRLRSALDPDRPKRTDGSLLITRQPGYLLAASPQDIDASRFEALAAEGRALLDTDPSAAALVLGDALAIWRGRALEQFTYEPWATAEIERLEELRVAAVEDRIDAELRRGRSGELVGELESLVRQHPFRQRMAAHLMLALHRSGRQGDALRAFGALRTRLGEELGLDPSHELVELEERIVVDDRSLHRPAASVSVTGRPEPGLAVRGYELRGKIGEGASGLVYRAFQPSVGREVSIKVIRPELANNADFIRRFQAEAQVIASLEHPRIVPVYDYWREPDAAYLVMRSYERGSLVDALADGPLATKWAIAILDQVGNALSVAHSRGITHGDLRPTNVLIDADGNAHLANFEMSFSVPRVAVGGTAFVDPFVAPEMRESGLASAAADVYAYAARLPSTRCVALWATTTSSTRRSSDRPPMCWLGRWIPIHSSATSTSTPCSTNLSWHSGPPTTAPLRPTLRPTGTSSTHTGGCEHSAKPMLDTSLGESASSSGCWFVSATPAHRDASSRSLDRAARVSRVWSELASSQRSARVPQSAQTSGSSPR